jgi:hypothetical protein
MHMTHNTGECCKYGKDGTLKRGFSRKAAIGHKCHGSGKKENSNSFVQIMERFSKHKKTVKKTQKSLQIVTLVILIWNRIVGMVVL